MSAVLVANRKEEEVWDVDPFVDDNDEEIIGETMTPEELEEVRRRRGEPNFVPTRVDPVHERFNDDQLCMLGPFLKCPVAPGSSELNAIVANHPVRSCRPGNPRYDVAMLTLARFCELKGGSWVNLRRTCPTLAKVG